MYYNIISNQPDLKHIFPEVHVIAHSRIKNLSDMLSRVSLE